MGGDDKCQIWNIRVTVTTKNPTERIVKFCQSYSAVKLSCYETATQPHTHIAYVADKPICRSTVKAHLIKYLDISGNADYSLSQPKEEEDLNGLYRYLCKGTGPDWETQKPEIIFNRDNLLDVRKYHEEFWSAQEAFKEKVKTLASKRQKEGIKQKYKIITELSEKYKGRESTVQTIDAITTDVIAAYKGNVNDNTLFTAVQSISHEIDPNTTALQACLRMRKKFFHNH